MDKALKFIYCRPLNYSCCVTAVRKDYELYKIQNNIMGYVTVENFPRPTGKRKWLSSGTEAVIIGRGKWDIINSLQHFLK